MQHRDTVPKHRPSPQAECNKGTTTVPRTRVMRVVTVTTASAQTITAAGAIQHAITDRARLSVMVLFSPNPMRATCGGTRHKAV
jgi:hypothetical protein